MTTLQQERPGRARSLFPAEPPALSVAVAALLLAALLAWVCIGGLVVQRFL